MAKSKITRPFLSSAAGQAGLSLTRSQNLKAGFLVTWLSYVDLVVNEVCTGASAVRVGPGTMDRSSECRAIARAGSRGCAV